jgi:crotonobetainyl-CoA:carnitine CoA-transferase CaiB-like acyl-CoA transferase
MLKLTKPLEGIKVVEIATWAYVPSAGAVLADWGADVVKIEPPAGDPIRGLVNAGVGPMDGITFTWEIFNRGKHGIALDLTVPGAQEIVYGLVEQADVFLTSLLPPVREKLGVDLERIRARNPQIIYAAGSGQGARGEEANRGGYDSITFWSRGSVSASVTPPDYHRPVGMPAGAFGDSISGMALAGGIAAAIAGRALTGTPTVVDGSLLGTAMWAMQMGIVGAAVAAEAPGAPAAPGAPSEQAASAGPAGAPAPARPIPRNPLVNNYQTSDNRWVALCMLQPDVYWEGLCRVIEREDLLSDPRFATPGDRSDRADDIVAEFDQTFLTRPLAHWLEVLARQKGQWDVVRLVTEVRRDPQAVTNRFIQEVAYSRGRSLPIVANPVQFDRVAPELKPAPEFGADTDAVLESLGMDGEAIIEAKIAGAVI